MLLPDDVKQQATKMLEAVTNPVTIEYHEDEQAQLNKEIKEILQAITEMNKNITLTIDDKGEDRPYFDLKGKNKGTIRFMGLPGGHEFSTLLSSIIMASDGDAKLSPETTAFLTAVQEPLDLKVFVTPTCPYCPAAVFLAQRMAMLNEHITGTMVEATEFPELSQKFNISGVPHTIINDQQGGFVGAHPEPSALAEIKKALGK